MSRFRKAEFSICYIIPCPIWDALYQIDAILQFSLVLELQMGKQHVECEIMSCKSFASVRFDL